MNTKELIKIEDDYFINTFTRQPIVLDHGDGVKVTDIEGNEYLDMFAGIAVNALGHNLVYALPYPRNHKIYFVFNDVLYNR